MSGSIDYTNNFVLAIKRIHQYLLSTYFHELHSYKYINVYVNGLLVMYLLLYFFLRIWDYNRYAASLISWLADTNHNLYHHCPVVCLMGIGYFPLPHRGLIQIQIFIHLSKIKTYLVGKYCLLCLKKVTLSFAIRSVK